MSEMYSVCINKTTPHRFTVKLNCREQFTTTWKELHFYYIIYYSINLYIESDISIMFSRICFYSNNIFIVLLS